MNDHEDYLALDDKQLLAQCRFGAYKASGPGGQHRNKVSSAVRLCHLPTGISSHGDDSRSQHENKRLALSRLRMEIALQQRSIPDLDHRAKIIDDCLIVPRKNNPEGKARLETGRKDARFWPLAKALLDIFDACEAQLAKSAAAVGVGSSNLVSQFKKDRHLFAAANQMRKKHGQKALS